MDMAFARSGALRPASPGPSRLAAFPGRARMEFAALVAALAARQATCATARAESAAARRRTPGGDPIVATARIFAPRRGEPAAAASLAGSFSAPVAAALATIATPGKPE